MITSSLLFVNLSKLEQEVKEMNFRIAVIKKLMIKNLQQLKENILSDTPFNFEKFDIYNFDNEAITKAVLDIKKEKMNMFNKRHSFNLKLPISNFLKVNSQTPSEMSQAMSPYFEVEEGK